MSGTLFKFVVVCLSVASALAAEQCQLYPKCTRFPLVDENCSGKSPKQDPCPEGRPVCASDPVTGEVTSCCCIKYDPVYKHLTTGDAKPALVPEKLRIYYMRFCPYTHRIMMTTVAKNVSADVYYINLKYKPAWHTTIGGRVPTTETEDGWINESLIEAEYLDELNINENPLYRGNLFQKGLDRQMIDAYNKVVPGVYFDIVYGKGFLNSSEIPALMTTLENYVTNLGNELTRRGTKYFNGDSRPGMVDYMIWPWMERRQIIPMFVPSSVWDYSRNSRRMAEWVDLMKQDNAVSYWGLEPALHYEWAVSSRNGNPAYDMLAGV